MPGVSALLFMLALLSGPTVPAHAQPGSGGPAPVSGTPAAVPIDGGASLLLASGVAYALRRLRRNRRKSKEHQKGRESGN